MGLFSSKSSSTSTTYNQSAQSSGTIGDLSTDNIITGGDYTYAPDGLSDENLGALLTHEQSLFEAAVGSVHKSAEQAINTAADAYADATGTTKNLFESLKPFALYATTGIVLYYLLKGKKW